jgi:hypothetical protein
MGWASRRWAKFSSVNLKQLRRSFEGTVIMDEALKETLERDLNVTKRGGRARFGMESTKKHTPPKGEFV